MDHEDATLSLVARREEEALQRSLRLLAGETVEVHVRLYGNLTVPELPDEHRIQRRQLPGDEFVGIGKIERRISGNQLGQLRKDLGVLVHPRRKRGPLRRLHAGRSLLHRPYLAHGGEELRALVTLGCRRSLRTRRKGRWRRWNGRLGELEPLKGIVERLPLLQMSRFWTSRAFFSMNSGRAPPASPIRRLKISSDSTASSTLT